VRSARSRLAIAALLTATASAPLAARAAEAPAVLLEPPAGWIDVPLERPDLSQSRQVRVKTWNAWGPAAASDVRLVAACLSAEADTWTPEAERIALDKVAQSASSTALRVSGMGALRPTSTDHDGTAAAIVSQHLEGTGDATGAALAKTFLAFAPHQIVGCFALCVDPHHDLACRASVEQARLTGDFTPPPNTSASLRLLLAAVHHPQVAEGVLAGLALAGAALTLATRRRPRRR
jgi:hypothetical protein